MRKVDFFEVAFVGSGLKRPECVYATKSGMIYASHADLNGRGGVACIHPDGRIELILAEKGDIPEIFITNGYALMPNGDFMIANLGPDGGGESSNSGGVANMDSNEISELTKAVVQVAQMGEGLSNFAKGKVQEEIRKEVNEILSKAIKQ